jgi:hypothetical protein
VRSNRFELKTNVIAAMNDLSTVPNEVLTSEESKQ